MSLEIYLGANTPEGFFSYFEPFADYVRKLYIIKGGPGSGKSTMMKKIARFAEDSGVRTIWIYCSSDSDSLDGVFLPDHGIMYVDGTAPHVLEAKTPGAREELIDFGQCFDTSMLSAKLEQIQKENNVLFSHYSRCYKYLKAAKQVKNCMDSQYRIENDILIKKAKNLASRTIPVRKNISLGHCFDVFMGSFTKNGQELRPLPPEYTVYPIYDPYSNAGTILDCLVYNAIKNGYDVFSAHDPYDPSGTPMHLLIPELNCAFVTMGRPFGYENAPGRRLRLDIPNPGADKKSNYKA